MTGTSDFDILRDHKAGPSRYFEDFEIGETFYIPSRTMTEALFAAFQLASGDNDPIHYDVNYCRARGHRHLLAHGMQIMIQTAAGAGTFPQQVADSILGMLELSGRILKPVYAGDTLYPRLTVSRLVPQNTTGIVALRAEVWNQDNARVFEGEHTYLIRRRGGDGGAGADAKGVDSGGAGAGGAGAGAGANVTGTGTTDTIA